MKIRFHIGLLFFAAMLLPPGCGEPHEPDAPAPAPSESELNELPPAEVDAAESPSTETTQETAEPSTGERTMHQYEAGQVWKYRTRPGEDDSRVVVLKVEEDERLGTIVHVRVEGLSFENPHAPNGVSDTIGHMPFASQSLDESVLEIESNDGELGDSLEGYETWKTAFDAGRAGVFTISLAESIEAMQATVERN